MLHQELESVIEEYAQSNWVIVIEDESIVHFYDSMESLKNENGEFVTVVRSEDGKVVYMSNNSEVQSGTINEVRDLLVDKTL